MIEGRKKGQLTIDITEPARFRLFGMMQTSCPVDCYVALIPRQSRGTLCGRVSVLLVPSPYGLRVRVLGKEEASSPMDPPAEMEQYSNKPSNMGQSSPTLSITHTVSCNSCRASKEMGLPATLSQLTFNLLLCELKSCIGRNAVQEIDVLVRVELGHLAFRSWFGALINGSSAW